MNIKECKILLRKSGHVYEDHINVTDDELIERLRFGKFDGYSYAGNNQIVSRFLTEELALKVIRQALNAHEEDISDWLKSAYDRKFVITMKFRDSIGCGYVKGTDWKKKYSLNELVLVLQADDYYHEYSVLTAYLGANLATRQQIQKDRREFALRKKH